MLRSKSLPHVPHVDLKARALATLCQDNNRFNWNFFFRFAAGATNYITQFVKFFIGLTSISISYKSAILNNKIRQTFCSRWSCWDRSCSDKRATWSFRGRGATLVTTAALDSRYEVYRSINIILIKNWTNLSKIVQLSWPYKKKKKKKLFCILKVRLCGNMYKKIHWLLKMCFKRPY